MADMVELCREPLLGHHVDVEDIQFYLASEGTDGMAEMDFLQQPSQPVAATAAAPAVAPVQLAASSAQPTTASEAQQPAAASEAQPAAAPDAVQAPPALAPAAPHVEQEHSVPPAVQAPPALTPAAPHVEQEHSVPPGQADEPPQTPTPSATTPNIFGPGTPFPGTPIPEAAHAPYDVPLWTLQQTFLPHYVPSVAPAALPSPYPAHAPSASCAPQPGVASGYQPVAVPCPPHVTEHGVTPDGFAPPFEFSKNLQQAMFAEMSQHLAAVATAYAPPQPQQPVRAPTEPPGQWHGAGVGNYFAGIQDSQGAPRYTSGEVQTTREFINEFATNGATVDQRVGFEGDCEEEAWGSEAEDLAMLQRLRAVQRSHPSQETR